MNRWMKQMVQMIDILIRWIDKWIGGYNRQMDMIDKWI